MTKKLAYIIIILISLISIGAFTQLPKVKLSYDFESFFPKDDPEIQAYDKFRKSFGTDNEYVLLGVENNAGIFDTSFLQKIDIISKQLKQLDLVGKVQSITTQKRIIKSPFGGYTYPLVHLHDDIKLKKDSVKIYTGNNSIYKLFVGENATSTLISFSANKVLTRAETDTLVSQSRAIFNQFEFDKIHVAGRIFGQEYYVNKMGSELVFFASLSILFLILFLTITFRSFWGVLVPLLIVKLTVVWQLAGMVVMGQSLDLLATILPTILFVVGISDVVHIINRYLEELRLGKTQQVAIEVAFKQVGLATFLTSLTTGIGFLTLLTASIDPIKDFGLYAAMGVSIAFLLAFSLLPAILRILPTPKIVKKKDWINWNRIMEKIFWFSVKKNKLVIGLSLVLIAVCFYGISVVKIDNYLLEDLPKGDPHLEDFFFFEKEFEGVRTFEFLLTAKDSSSLLSFEHKAFVEELEKKLEKTFETKGIQSPLMAIRFLNQMNNGGKNDAFLIPNQRKIYTKLTKELKKIRAKQDKLGSFLSKEGNVFRFSGKIHDLGGNKMNQLNLQLKNWVSEKGRYNLEVTGIAYLIDKTNSNLASDMMLGLGIAFAVVALIMGVLFRSVTMVLITLVPNILPLIMIGGVMGALGIDLKISTSIIFTIAFGIAVDDTIHYMSKLKLELYKGHSFALALRRASISTGKAIVITSLILISGFISMVFSSFASTLYIGLLVSLTLLFAVIADLLLLPALIVTFYKK